MPGPAETQPTVSRRSVLASCQANPARELQVHGSGDLLRWLLERDLTLVESRATPSGVTLQTHRPTGRAASATRDAGPFRAAGL
jgi:hypothetical protein